jgi:two-component system, NarL family, captular synthesis response regulator RcsB
MAAPALSFPIEKLGGWRRRGSVYSDTNAAYTYNMREKFVNKLRILLADDHPFVLLGVRSVLAAHSDVAIVGEANTPAALIRLLQSTACDVLITDLTMPDAEGPIEDGLSLIRRIRRDWPSLRIVVLTSLTNTAILHSIVSDGVAGVLNKIESMEHLWPVIRAAVTGEAPFEAPHGESSGRLRDDGRGPVAAHGLSPRQSEVIGMFVRGRSISEIALALGRDRRTVSRQKRDAMAKLGITNDPGLFAYARAHGLA